MTKHSFAASLALLALLGAGCSSPFVPPSQPSQSSPITPPAASEPAASEPTMNRPTNLAFPGVLPTSETDVKVRMKTSKGDIVLQLLPSEGPNAASNFVYLVNQKFYDGLTFHRVIPGFMAQGGDPQGRGTGGPGYQFPDDPVSPTSSHISQGDMGGQQMIFYKKGTLAMANAGPNTNGSQFFIMNADAPMDGPKYSIFGEVIEGIGIVEKLQIGDVMQSVTIER